MGASSSAAVAAEWADAGENNIKEVFVIGAGTLAANGMYARVEVAGIAGRKPRIMERNDAAVYRNENGFLLSREVIGDQVGWILGNPPDAYYGVLNSSHIPPSCLWTGTAQYAGDTPFPTISLDRRDLIQSNGEKIEAAKNISTTAKRREIAKFKSAAAFVGSLKRLRNDGGDTQSTDRIEKGSSWRRAMGLINRSSARSVSEEDLEASVPLSPASSSSGSPRKPGKAFFPLSPGHAPRRGRRNSSAWSSPKSSSLTTDDENENSLNISRDDRYRYYANRLKKNKKKNGKKNSSRMSRQTQL
eukprot:g2858.t1